MNKHLVIILSIPKYLKNKIESIPEKPGIYKMIDSQGNIIYIGKSKCLKKRVKSYFYTNHDFNKINQLVFNIHDIDFIVTDTHLEAQLLECKLIKKYRPIYNSQYKNDKKYVYLKIEDYNRFNSLSLTIEKENEYSFGPYRSKNILLNLIELLKKLYPIKKHLNSYKFAYNPLPSAMEKDDFEKNRQCLIEIFSQEECMKNFMSTIETNMKEASSSLHFERASYYRDTLSSIEYLYNLNKIHSPKNDRILMGEKLDDGYKLFYILDGNLILKKKFPRITVKNIEDFLSQAKALESHDNFHIDEKSNLDFRAIVSRELQVNLSKTIQITEENTDLELFINHLLS
ncbi:UvrB/UvrC motif-containing protein [Clostridium sp. Cult3]|uniref:UvrB/UvrC motif-containing protein n=1 Tax=Clostridium sp. Cult3 TaxID=2079004 RepID=UPI001F002CE9|nr:UvrB/UvrC motif-containing protein [Clostridium sp. Cult3]MCF6460194.1 hypothetical protein [Clostridium sp. Cult3]